MFRMWAPIHLLSILLFLISPRAMIAQSSAPEFRARFERDTDPLHRAKMMPQLGEAEFQQIDKDVAAGNLAEALEVAREYRDQVQSCEKALDAKEADPEKHPSGFKQLQISLRQSLRRLDEMMVTITGDEQVPFIELRKDLDQLDRHLIRELFPNQPGNDSRAGKPKN
jgi:hypothetical protein